MNEANLAQQLAELSVAERIQLIQDLWDSVAKDPEALTLSAAQTKELERRLKAYRTRTARGVVAGSSWSDVKQRVRRNK